jgi:phosphoesterase RecJ-like protein
MVMSKIRYFYDNRFAVITITENDIKTAGATADQTEGFIDFIMGIDTVEVGASVMEIAKNKYKISFRSKSANVNAVAGSFGGGGHVLASGCQISGEYEEVIDRISFAVSRELPEI